MSIRFRRSMKVAPGVRLNIGKGGGSVRIGGRGAGYTVGTSGQRIGASLPGTGLHTSQKIGGRKARKDKQQADKDPNTAGWLLFAGAVAVLMALFVW